MSVHVQFLAALENASHTGQAGHRVLGSHLRGYSQPFAQRHWLVPQGHVTHILVAVKDSEEEVEVWINEAEQSYGYDCPAWKGRRVVRPLQELALYVFNPNPWLDELTVLMGIEPTRRSRKRTLVDGALWHLGDVRITGTHDFAPVFVGCKLGQCHGNSLDPATKDAMAALADPIWPRGGVVLRLASTKLDLPGDHVTRGLAEFVRYCEAGGTTFDGPALDRVLHGFVSPQGLAEPEQFLQGNRVKLPHFEKSRILSPTCAVILKVMWGGQEKVPPVVKWAQVNEDIGCGYRSFDEAFGGKAIRQDYLNLVRAGGHYQLRRNHCSVALL